MNVQAVIFDLDGTLLDTLTDIADSCNRVLIKHGFPDHSLSAYRYFVGDGVVSLMERILPQSSVSKENLNNLLASFKDDYSRNWAKNSKPYDGVQEMLLSLERAGLPMAILSNKPHEFTVSCVEHFFPQTKFSAVVGLREGIAKKPDPYSALELANKMAVEPENFIFLGDSSVDMQTAISAGMNGVGALWGFRTKQELLDSGAVKVISHPSELLLLIS